MCCWRPTRTHARPLRWAEKALQRWENAAGRGAGDMRLNLDCKLGNRSAKMISPPYRLWSRFFAERLGRVRGRPVSPQSNGGGALCRPMPERARPDEVGISGSDHLPAELRPTWTISCNCNPGVRAMPPGVQHHGWSRTCFAPDIVPLLPCYRRFLNPFSGAPGARITHLYFI